MQLHLWFVFNYSVTHWIRLLAAENKLVIFYCCHCHVTYVLNVPDVSKKLLQILFTSGLHGFSSSFTS